MPAGLVQNEWRNEAGIIVARGPGVAPAHPQTSAPASAQGVHLGARFGTGNAMINRWCPALLLLLWSGLAQAVVIDVKVYDAFGSAYPTTQIGEQLGSLYDLDFKTTMVLVLGPGLSDERLLEQEAILTGIDPGEYGILFAVGTPGETYTRGFSITPNAAAGLLPSADAFRVFVLDPTGRVLHQSSTVIPREELLRIAPGR